MGRARATRSAPRAATSARARLRLAAAAAAGDARPAAARGAARRARAGRHAATAAAGCVVGRPRPRATRSSGRSRPTCSAARSSFARWRPAWRPPPARAGRGATASAISASVLGHEQRGGPAAGASRPARRAARGHHRACRAPSTRAAAASTPAPASAGTSVTAALQSAGAQIGCAPAMRTPGSAASTRQRARRAAADQQQLGARHRAAHPRQHARPAGARRRDGPASEVAGEDQPRALAAAPEFVARSRRSRAGSRRCARTARARPAPGDRARR